MKLKKPELLAPAGDLKTLEYALIYGADAVYVGGKIGSLRTSKFGFSISDLRKASKICKKLGKKIYLALNIVAHNDDLKVLGNYLEKIKDIDFNAFIISDLGVINLVKSFLKKYKKKIDIHISTQANITNLFALNEVVKLGVKRIVLARELSLKEINEFTKNSKAQIETFVHGAMCISYSGRCLLSNYMTNRESNHGECAGSCRWVYKLIEEKRPNEEFLIEEDKKGTYIFNSKDLCLVNHIDELIKAGVDSFKIEGRMKSVYYTLSVVRAYRFAIDEVFKNLQKSGGIKGNKLIMNEALSELYKTSYRDFTIGFFKGKQNYGTINYETRTYIRNYDFIGIVLNNMSKAGEFRVEQRNYFKVSDEVEIFGYGEIGYFKTKILKILRHTKNSSVESIKIANHPLEKLTVVIDLENLEFVYSKNLKENKKNKKEGLTLPKIPFNPSIQKDFIIRKKVSE